MSGNWEEIKEDGAIVQTLTKKSTYSDADRKYYQTHKQYCLDISRPHKKAYWLTHKEELKAKRREYYQLVEKPLRLAKKLNQADSVPLETSGVELK
jgi:hypothetical protein